jgi:hypothetical protein
LAGLELFANQAQTTVSSGGTTAPASGTSETWTVASSTAFPAATSSASTPTFFRVTDVNPGTSGEKMIVTNVSGTTWTVTRGTEGTTPVVHVGGFTVQNVTTAASLEGLGQSSGESVNAVTRFGADPTGGADSTTAIQMALLSFGTATGWLQGEGGIVDLGPGSFHISNTLIIPPGVILRGAGRNVTMITMATAVAADVIQMEIYNSASQAAILAATVGGSAPAQADLVNAFYSGVKSLGIHGNSYYTTIPSYSHGINVTTNPSTSQAGSDPAFDPSHVFDDVYVQACTGDGYFHSGRSACTLTNVWVEACRGNGATSSFDTLFANCNLGFNGVAGVYVDHGATNGASIKSYNNGCNPVWTSGQAWSAGNGAVYGGNLYFCISANSGTTAPSSDGTHWVALVSADGAWVSGTSYAVGNVVTSGTGTYICTASVTGTTAPSSDASHWSAPTPAWVSGTAYTAGVCIAYAGTMYYCLASVTGSTVPSSDAAHWLPLNAATSPQVWGWDYAFDGLASGSAWTGLDSQEPSIGSYWLNGCAGCTISGIGATVNFDNPGTGLQNTSNPNGYSAVYLNGINGCNIDIALSTFGGIAYGLYATGSSRSNITLATDGTEQGLLAPGASLAGTATLLNGAVQSVLPVNGGTDTSGTATASTPTFTSGTAKQLSTVQDVMLYVNTHTATATFSLAMGPTSSAANTIVASATAPITNLYSVLVPKGWYVKMTFTSADVTFTQVTC